MTVDLYRFRRSAALSQRELARLAGVSPATVFKAEQGKPVFPSTVRKLAQALGVTPSELYGDVRPRSHRPPSFDVSKR